MNYFVPNHLRNEANAYLDNVYPMKYRKDYFNIELIEKSKDVIKLLSDELANSKYFNLNSPNEIDALIFGYLAVILKFDLPRFNNLHQCLLERKNLIDYVNRILNEFFPEFDQQSTETKTNPKKNVEENYENVSWKSILLVGTLAVTTNLLYILYLVADDSKDEDSESDEDD